MTVLKERKLQPKADNKCYLHKDKKFNGYNECILENSKTGSVLPNCTGYCYGRYLEANGLTKCNLPTCNAEAWFLPKYTKNLPHGNVPKVGAIIVWSKGKVGVGSDGAGHVAFIEHINYNKDGSIKSLHCSMSGAGASTKVWTEDIKPPFVYKKGYKLEGFIYSPIEFEDTNKPKPTTKDQYKLLFDKWLRKQPKVAINKIVKVAKGTILTSKDNKLYTDNKNNKWIYTTTNGKTGYVCIEDNSGSQALKI